MNYIELLQAALRPAFGCTEPIALAYAAAKSVAVLGECPTSMTARCSANIIKNVKSVTIPNSGGRKGLACVAILGVIPCLEQQITYNTAISAAEQLGKSQEELYRALAFGNLLTLYIKSGIGKLSAYCGVVSAGVAGVAAVAFLKGDSQQIIEDTVSNGLANTSGIVCEGMKQTDVVILNEMLKH